MDSSQKLNLAVLRLASQVKIDKYSSKCQNEDDRLLWECHKAQVAHADSLDRLSELLSQLSNRQRQTWFQKQLQDAREILQGNQVNLEVVQKLVHQVYTVPVNRVAYFKPFRFSSRDEAKTFP